MATKEDIAKSAVESADKLAVEVYKDTLAPTAKAIGNIVALPFQAIDAALAKPKMWVAEQQYNYERTKALLAEKLKNTPPEKICPPENYIAIPALQQISYCFDSDELRDMYANLLAASMHEDRKWEIHPAYVDIIKQLTPDEAKLLRIMPPETKIIYPIIDVYLKQKQKRGHIVICSNYSNIGDKICDCPQNIASYLDNLNRLEIITIDKNSHVIDKSPYEKLKNTQFIKKVTTIELSEGQSYDFNEGIFYLTSFGLNFVKSCIHRE